MNERHGPVTRSRREDAHFVYIGPGLDTAGRIIDRRLNLASDRHRIKLRLPALEPASGAFSDLPLAGAAGVVLGTYRGLPDVRQLDLAERALGAGHKVLFYWPRESALGVMDAEGVRTLRRHWRFLRLYCRYVGHRQWLGVMDTPQTEPSGDAPHTIDTTASAQVLDWACNTALDDILEAADPVPWSPPTGTDGAIAGTGLYLRTDFWAPVISGGSYGHTCYVARSLADSTRDLVCVVATPFPMLETLGLEQIVLEPPEVEGNEMNILRANAHYDPVLRRLVEARRPAYIYERMCLGNYLGARLSQEYRIPYIVEYNGSEISMMRSFEGRGYIHEDLYLKAEEAAFRQATMVSVISEAVKADVVGRGVSPNKVLVNPNGASPSAYAPPGDDAKEAVRRELGWHSSHVVVGFTGTFGGWHGIDVLAAALPEICRRRPEVRFLLIGDGNFRHRVDTAIETFGLDDRIHMAGRTSQSEGARLMQACDLFVSPHSSDMIDSRFFGSPTKIFEYMALGGGIVASDLEQIGVVLSPALRPGDFADGPVTVTDQRSVLVPPGDVAAFVDAVTALAGRPEVARQLGRNARRAVLDHYSWDQHIARLLQFLAEGHVSEDFLREFYGSPFAGARLATDDAYKEEAQSQWDKDPAGSHYVKEAKAHTLDWYMEAESYRYDDYAPWMKEVMEFDLHRGARVLEVGGGMGTDLAQFAMHGAEVTDLDLSAGHLAHAEENFRLRGLAGRFVHGDAEDMPFDDADFDLVYSNGVIHHTPDTAKVIGEIRRVLRPGGRLMVMVYAQNSLHYWRNLVRDYGIAEGQLELYSMGEIMSRHAELSPRGAKPLVKVYTRKRLRRMFAGFGDVTIVQRQITPAEMPRQLKRMPVGLAGKLFGWNLVLKAGKAG